MLMRAATFVQVSTQNKLICYTGLVLCFIACLMFYLWSLIKTESWSRRCRHSVGDGPGRQVTVDWTLELVAGSAGVVEVITDAVGRCSRPWRDRSTGFRYKVRLCLWATEAAASTSTSAAGMDCDWQIACDAGAERVLSSVGRSILLADWPCLCRCRLHTLTYGRSSWPRDAARPCQARPASSGRRGRSIRVAPWLPTSHNAPVAVLSDSPSL